MIQFNLLPDVKMKYIRAKNLNRTAMVISALVAGATVTVFVLLFLTVNLYQKVKLNNLSKSIDSESKTLTSTPDLNKVLTIQNQLNSLSGLYVLRPAATRTFGYLSQITPANVDIGKYTYDFTTNSMQLSGTADNLGTLNTFVDTLKFTNYTDGSSSSSQKPAFKSVVLSSYGTTDKQTSYSISLTADPTLFLSTSNPTLIVPQQVTTRSETDKPTDLFKALPAPKI